MGVVLLARARDVDDDEDEDDEDEDDDNEEEENVQAPVTTSPQRTTPTTTSSSAAAAQVSLPQQQQQQQQQAPIMSGKKKNALFQKTLADDEFVLEEKPRIHKRTNTRSLEWKFDDYKTKAIGFYKDAKGLHHSVPPTGGAIISYAKLLQLLTKRRVKRIWMYGDGDMAIVEVVSQGWETSREGQTFEPNFSTMRQYLSSSENPELSVEKERFLCYLPADVWDDGHFMSLIKNTWPQIDHEGRAVPNFFKHSTCHLAMVPHAPHAYYAIAFTQAKTILFAMAVRAVYDFIVPLIPEPGKPEQEEVEEAFIKARAKIFNLDVDDPLFQEQILDKENLNFGIGGRGTTGVLFDDVAGIDHVLEPLKDAINAFMKTSPLYEEMDIEPPKGILLYGPPGTGKTMVARAIAGEAGVPFFSISGSEFVEMYEGIAASRMADLFKQARAAKPSIVFIDEIDTIGAARRPLGQGDLDSGSREREMGLIRMLYELDGSVDPDTGKSSNEGIIFMAATNRPESLDQALLRSGRFDMIIAVTEPNESNRKKILQVHGKRYLGSLPKDDKVREQMFEDMARVTSGFSGAELVNLLNETAIITVREGRREANYRDFMKAFDRYTIGLNRMPMPVGTRVRSHVSLIYAARAVCGAYEGDDVNYVSVNPTDQIPARIEIEPYLYLNREGKPNKPGPIDIRMTDLLPNYFREIELNYTGRAIEEVLYGKAGVTPFTANETWVCAEFARWIVMESGGLPPKERSGLLGKGWGKPKDRTLRSSDDGKHRKMSEVQNAWEDPLSVFNTDEFVADRTSAVRWAQGKIGPKDTHKVDPTHALLDHVLTSIDIGILQVQAVAYEGAKERVLKLLPVIQIIAEELATNENARVEGDRIRELLEEHKESIDRAGRVRSVHANASNGTVVFAQERPPREGNMYRLSEDFRRREKEARIGSKVAFCTFAIQYPNMMYNSTPLERIIHGEHARTSTVLTEPWFRQIMREQEWDAAGVGRKAHELAKEQVNRHGEGAKWDATNLAPLEGPHPWKFERSHDPTADPNQVHVGEPLWMPRTVEISDEGYAIFQGNNLDEWNHHIAGSTEMGEHYSGWDKGGFEVGPSDPKFWMMNVDHYRKFFSPYGVRHRKGYKGRLPFTPVFLTPDEETQERGEERRKKEEAELPKHRTLMEDSPTLQKLQTRFAEMGATKLR